MSSTAVIEKNQLKMKLSILSVQFEWSAVRESRPARLCDALLSGVAPIQLVKGALDKRSIDVKVGLALQRKQTDLLGQTVRQNANRAQLVVNRAQQVSNRFILIVQKYSVKNLRKDHKHWQFRCLTRTMH